MRSKTGKRIAFFAVAFIVAASVCIASVLSTPKAYARDTYGLKSDIETALTNFENKFNAKMAASGEVYVELPDAYSKYVALSKIYDQYYLGNNIDDLGNKGIVQSYITQLNEVTDKIDTWTSWSPKTVIGNNMTDTDRLFSYDSGDWGNIKNDHKNLLWLEKGYNTDSYGRGWVDHSANEKYTILEINYPISVMVYDGTTTPTFPVLVGARGEGGTGWTNNKKRYFYGASVNNSNLKITRPWRSHFEGGTSTRDYYWNYTGSIILASSPTDSTTTSLQHKNNSNNRYAYAATYIDYLNPADSGVYVEKLRPSFTLYAGGSANPQQDNGGNWTGDIFDTITGDTDIYVINYKLLIDAVKSGVKDTRVTDCLKNIADYSEGGLNNVLTAFKTAMDYDYNGKITASGTNESTLIPTLSGEVDAIGNDIKNAVDGINNALSGAMTKDGDGFESLRKAIKDTLVTYDAGNTPIVYCDETWNGDSEGNIGFAKAFKNAQDFIADSGKTGNYSDPAQAQSLATALNDAYAKLTKHELTPEQEELRNAGKYQEANDGLIGAVSEENVKKATCTEDGHFDFLWMCQNCHQSIDDKTSENITIPKIDHSSQMTKIEAKTDAYCNEKNYPAYYQCNVVVGGRDGLDPTYYAPCHKYFEEPDGSGMPYESEEAILAVIGTAGTQHKNLERTEANDPDCATKTNGNVAYVHCTDCGKYFAADDTRFEHPQNNASSFTVEWKHTIDPDEDKTEAKAKTCTTPGNNEYYTCSVCKQKFKNAAGTDPADDNYINIPASHGEAIPHPAVKETCTTDGNKQYWECKDCGEYFSKDSLVNENKIDDKNSVKIPKCHIFGAKTEGKDATCVDPGQEECYKCTREGGCGKYYSTNDKSADIKTGFDAPKVIDATGHVKCTLHEAIPATCIADGRKAYYTCDVCSKAFKTDATGTTRTDYVENPETNAELKETKNPKNHATTPTPTPAVTPSCITMKDGNKAYVYCKDCKNYYAADDTGFEHPQKDANSFTVEWKHDFNNGKTEKKEPTCVADGNNEYYECSACKQKFLSDDLRAETPASDDEITIKHTDTDHPAALKHIDRQEKECYKDGVEDHYYCETCKKNFSDEAGTEPMDNIVIPRSHGDVITHDEKRATCMEGGNKLYYECKDCHDYFNDDSLTDKIEDKNSVNTPIDTTFNGHYDISKNQGTLVSRNISPTCTKDGETGYQCTQCKRRYTNAAATQEIKDNSYIVPKCHELTEVKGKDATCVENGLEKCWQCTREGAGSCGQKYYSTNNPTTEEKGFDAPKVLQATGHKCTLVKENPATCKDEGRMQYYTCDYCHKAFKTDATGTTSKVYVENPETNPELKENINPKNHKNAKEVAYQRPTCQAEGMEAHVYCDACGNYYDSMEDAKANRNAKSDDSTYAIPKNHAIDPVEAKDPTCAEGGNYAYWKCHTCGTCFDNPDGSDDHIIEESTKLRAKDPANHTDLKPVAIQPETCDKDGVKAHYYCSGCKTKFTDDKGLNKATDEQLKIPAHHVITKEHKAVTATCVVEGWKAYWECEKCGKFFENKNDTEPLDDVNDMKLGIDENNHVNIVPVAAVPSDCKTQKNGVKAHYQCSDCKDIFTDKDGQKPTTLSALADPYKHTLSEIPRVAPTCTAVGYEKHYKCSVCEKLFTDNQGKKATTLKALEIAKIDHTRGDVKTVIDDEATCTKKGRQHDEVYCKVCGQKFIASENVRDIPMTPHTRGRVETVIDKDATCKEKGRQHDEVYCSVCKNKFIESENAKDIPMIPHKGPRKTITDVVATCYAEGKEHDANVCDTCGEEYNKSAERTVAKLPHPDGTKVTRTKKEATCRETGLEYDALVCVICGEEYNVSPDRETPKIYHRTGSINRVVLKEATCTQTGEYYDEYTCNMCGKVYGKSATVTQPMIPHTQGKVEKSVIKESTCTEKGRQENKLFCKVCGQNYSSFTSELDLKPHTAGDPIISEYVAPMADRVGSYLKTIKCTVCGKVLSQKRVPIQPTGSDPDDDVDLEIIYDVTDSTYLEYSGTGADIHCSGPLDMFIAVMMDGKLVDESKYDLFDGSTLVSFHSDYLDGLRLGKHEVVLLYTYDSITTNLTIYGTNGETEPEKPPVVDPNAGNSGSGDNTGSTVTNPVADDKPGTAEDKLAANGGSAISPETGIKVAVPAFLSVAFVGAYILFGSKKRKNDGD